MDIVSRIKTFLSENGIANSIFADKCDIPRPTLSQLLNGRNKKVSNEILDKIHIAYPELSMMWLIFGEGDMLSEIGQNITTPPSHQLNENEEFSNNLFSDSNNTSEKNPESMSQVLQSISRNFEKNKNNTKRDENGCTKKIVNVMVFYSDNSFESFTPNK